MRDGTVIDVSMTGNLFQMVGQSWRSTEVWPVVPDVWFGKVGLIADLLVTDDIGPNVLDCWWVLELW